MEKENMIDFIDFGIYKGEPIKWRVLKQDEKTLLLITDRIIDAIPYNINEKVETTWEKSSLRKWLNNDFFNSAFSHEEKTDIIECDVQAENNPLYSTNPGNSTNDKVFILSINQAERLFDGENARKTCGTNSAVENGLFEDSEHNSWWWLRSPGEHGRSTAVVHSNGVVLNHGIPVFYSSGGVRPAIWIKR